jgi:DNA modification methylase
MDLLKRSVRPGDTVLDCFAGSGTILEAAHRMKVTATALEMNPEYYGMCLTRAEGLDKLPSTDQEKQLGDELMSMLSRGN